VKASELREMTDRELQDRLRQARDELFRLRFQHATKQLGNPGRLSEVRRDVARILTLLRQREQAAQAERG
jgi:large subunit ribosomal protein L29